ncbi:hypothetical protein LSH36_954g00016 [Paralvinella palmiformis]|uniref:Uncharacterized protein n=1 Tax=Paralvinella palmiformis TaxID=53620 RepID=A0AAD9MSF0_9ANNE|nr:hypothetical protein LSH36_954g00016 [Paralvinella palmiformis]
MEVYKYLEFFGIFAPWALFMTFNYFYNVIRSLYWIYTGVHQQVTDSEKPESYNRSVEVKKILFRRTIDGYIKHPESAFLTVHETFVNPERVLQDDCSLYAMTPTEAIFIQVKNRIFLHDFLWMGQFAVADKLISIPLNHFNKLAEEMEDEGAKIIFLHNQGRCGGTLVTALFKETARRMFRNTIRMLCKPYGALGERIVAYVIQPMLLDMVCIEMVQEVFPEAVQFFIYRNPIEVSISLRRIEEILTPIKVMINLSNVASIVRLSLEFIGEHNTEYRAWTYPIHPEFQFGFRGACFTTYYYLEALKRGINIHGVRYEQYP